MEKILEKFAEVNEQTHGCKWFDALELAREIALAVSENNEEDAKEALQELENIITEIMHSC